MQKFQERIRLENKIKNAHDQAITVAMRMVEKEYKGDLEKALVDKPFVSRIQNKVKETWEAYRNGYEELEKLEAKEGYPAMFAYARQLDLIAEHLPQQTRIHCYYPFSGVDFYWPRIFKKVIFEDIAFYEEEKPQNTSDVIQYMWWSLETYGVKKRIEIISKLKSLKIIPQSVIMKFVAKDADVSGNIFAFNNKQSTLLLKGGSESLEYIEKQFNRRPLEYGGLIIEIPVNQLKNTEERLARDGYRRSYYLKGNDFLPPYAMPLKDVCIFLRKV
jgi:hypothetical protein